MAKQFDNPFNPNPTWSYLEFYCEPLCYDLTGKAFQLVMDNGEDYAIRFMNEEMVEWGSQGKPMRWDKYECLKMDDQTFFVNCELFEVQPRTCVTLVLDLKANLVTAVVARQGAIKNRPLIVKSEVIFGAIKMPGRPINHMRHGYTNDMSGTKILWRYAPNFSITHSLTSEHYLRVPLGPRPVLAENATPEEKAAWEAEIARRNKSFFEIPAFYIKIREDLILYSFTEESYCWIDPTQPGNNLLMLVDVNRVHDIGRVFAYDYENNYAPQNFMFSAFGDFQSQPDDTDYLESPYFIL